MHPIYLIHTNRKTISLVPQLAPRPAGPAERRYICQQHALSQRKNCSASSVIQKNLHNTSTCIKKQKAEKEKKQGENSGKKENTPRQPTASQERRTASEERRKQDLSIPKRTGSPSSMHNSCVQVHTMGNHPSSTNSDSNEELEIDDLNAPEITEDDLTEDEDIDELQNRPENDTAVSVGNLLNFPDLLCLNTSGQDTNNSEAENSYNETFPLSHSCGARPKSPLPTGNRSNWRQPPLQEVTLPHLNQPPGAEGCCIPPYKEPPEP